MIGRVKWFNNEKGYGFIEYKAEEDIFVHYSAIEQDGYKTLSEGQLVEFDLIDTDKGFQAHNVKLVKELAAVN
ncbi:MAG: cold shock domain-containing protein [Bacilli bacterium]|nr:cold shock domain-containing protein [Bacilli bacterium]MBQ3468971.1 cold shock domain-containing protein [Bacilli bacterium]